MPHCCFPINAAHLSQLMNIDTLILTKVHTLFRFPWFLPDVLVLFQDATQVIILPLFVIFS